MARVVHDWELPPAHSWENPVARESESDGPDSDPETRGGEDPEYAASMLLDYILALFFAGQLSAKSVAVI